MNRDNGIIKLETTVGVVCPWEYRRLACSRSGPEARAPRKTYAGEENHVATKEAA
jgi:hypothetical protein